MSPIENPEVKYEAVHTDFGECVWEDLEATKREDKKYLFKGLNESFAIHASHGAPLPRRPAASTCVPGCLIKSRVDERCCRRGPVHEAPIQSLLAYTSHRCIEYGHDRQPGQNPRSGHLDLLVLGHRSCVYEDGNRVTRLFKALFSGIPTSQELLPISRSALFSLRSFYSERSSVPSLLCSGLAQPDVRLDRRSGGVHSRVALAALHARL